MPPKGRPVRKVSVTTSHPTRAEIGMSSKNKPQSKASMPPPPSPVSATILGPEMQALEKSLKEAAVNTGRIFRFYADTRKERIASHVPYPPRSITRTLGRSLERYDQICDTVETHLLHAISVLERDLKAEQDRIDAEASASVATRTRSKRPSVSPTASRIPLPNMSPPPGSEQLMLTESPTSTIPSSQFPPPSGASAISLTSRRPSAILSSLHRPSFPLKLDLSPAALAGNIDPSTMGQPMDVNVDLGLTSLPSPVTLAPKTARALPNDSSISDIFGVGSSQGLSSSVPDSAGPSESGSISGNVGMKTTMPVQEGVIDLTEPEASGNNNTQLGDSADKPIELDLEGNYDDMDLFGDVQTSTDTANAANTTSQPPEVTVTSTQLDVDMDGLFTPQDNQTNSFQLEGALGQSDNSGAAPDPDILASLGSNTGDNENSNDLSSLLPGDGGHSVNNGGHTSGDSFPGLGSGAETQFDLSSIDLSSLSGLFDGPGDAGGSQSAVGGEDEMDLMKLLAMDEGQTANTSGGEGDAAR